MNPILGWPEYQSVNRTIVGLGDTATDIATLLGSAGQAATTALNASNAPPGYVFNPTTGQYVPAIAMPTVAGYSTGTTVSANLTGSLLPLILGFGALLVLVMVMKK